MVQSILAHNDAVTSVCYQTSTTNVVSVSHDGSLKIWDLRKYGLVQELHVILYNVKSNKYKIGNTFEKI